MKPLVFALATASAFAAVFATVAADAHPVQTRPHTGQPAAYGRNTKQTTPQKRVSTQQASTRPTSSKPNKSGLDSDGNRRTNNGKGVPLLDKVRGTTQANTSN